METKRRYSCYATLLDAFQNFLDAEKNYNLYFSSDNAKMTVDEWCEKQRDELIERINRVSFTSEAAAKGTAFNQLVDALIKHPQEFYREQGCGSEDITFTVTTKEVRKRNDEPRTEEFYDVVYTNTTVIQGEDSVAAYSFSFPKMLVDEFATYYEGASSQVYCSGTLNTAFGEIDLYGYIDELLPFSVHDIKTCKCYKAGKFKDHWQHIVYPFCLRKSGIDVAMFEYNVTDFKDTYTELYVYEEQRDVPRLRDICERFIQFIEQHRERITDTRVFRSRF